MTGRLGPTTTDHSRRELFGLGALVVLLGIAFVTLLVEPTQASARPGLERIAPNAVVELPVQDLARLAGGRALVPAPPDEAVEAAALPAEAVVVPTALGLDGMRLGVVRLGIDLPLLLGDAVRDSVRQSTPIGAAFLLPSSVPPGGSGNAYVYAHARPGMFLSLWDVRLGDVVEITTRSSGVWRYVVTEIHARVGSTDFQYTLPSGDERLTLQTSTGPGDADPRFVVVAVRDR